MRTRIACRRTQRRHPVAPGADTRVEFEYPPGREWNEPLVDISVSGISFALDEVAPHLDCGTNVPRVRIAVGSCVMNGDLLVMHVTATGGRAVCGALFYPATDDDLVKLKSVIAGIEAVRPETESALEE